MSKYTRSLGKSFTSWTGDKKKLNRHIKLKNKKHENSCDIKGENLGSFFLETTEILLRQSIGVFDKIIIKPKSLRWAAKETYIDRTKLSYELWKELESYWIRNKILEKNDEKITHLKGMWNSKIHPYAQSECSFLDLDKDENLQKIKRWNNSDVVTREKAKGVWHDAFWRTQNNTSKPDYPQIAKLIFQHLTKQDYKVCLDKKTKEPIKRELRGLNTLKVAGLAERRGDNISRSVYKLKDVEKNNDNHISEIDEDKLEIVKLVYFDVNIAEKIFNKIFHNDK